MRIQWVMLSLMAIFIVFNTGSAVATETITFATLNWEPFIGEELPEKGFFSALTREVFKRAGYDMKLEFMTWNRALELARRGKYDGLLGAYYNEDREKDFYYPDPVAKSQEVFVQRKGSKISYTHFSELKKYKIGSLLGGASGAALREQGFNVEDTADEIMSLKKLKAGRIDLHVMGMQQFYYLTDTDAFLKKIRNEFEVVSPPYKEYDVYGPISKKTVDGENIVKKFNKALQEIKSDGTFDKIMIRFGQKNN